VDTLCSDEGKKRLTEIAEESPCNRMVIGACQPYLYRPTLKNKVQNAGFSPFFVAMRDLASIVHAQDALENGKDLTETAFHEIQVAIDHLKLQPPLTIEQRPINQTVLVVGGGMAGMEAALFLADQGVAVHLVEKADTLGGYAGNRVHTTIDNRDLVAVAKKSAASVTNHEKITVHLNCEITAGRGSFGSLETTIHDNHQDKNTFLHHGAAIIATGGREGKIDEYCYTSCDGVVTQGELKEGLYKGTMDPGTMETVVMIQCAGSRKKEGRRYCSRICCIGAVENALAVKKQNPDARVIVLYRDMTTPGFAEEYYTAARMAGVIFVSYDLDREPVVELVDDKPRVTCFEPVLNCDMEITADLVVLSTGVDPEPANRELGRIFDLPVDDNGFFTEADPKWRPVEFRKNGFFLAGTAHSPMGIKEVIVQARAAAQKALAAIFPETINQACITSTVHLSLCVRCQLCVEICPYGARSYDLELDRIVVDGAACQACGMCAAACRNNAAEVTGWSDRQIMAVIDSKMELDAL